ncbi:MAG: class I SAM-dependent methyltransferase [Nannocystaceae bacterium]
MEITTETTNTRPTADAPRGLGDPRITRTLDRLHAEARGDWKKALGILPAAALGLLRGKSLMKSITPAQLAGIYIPVSREQGEFLYILARARGARRIVEFGASFGISTVYLAAAAAIAGGEVITTEIEPSKCRAAEANLREAGLDAHARVLEGDALQTLTTVDGPIDLLFLDGWKDLYIPVLELVRAHLVPGALVIADNINLRDARPYVDHVRRPGSGFTSTVLHRGRLLLSCHEGTGA